VPPGVVLVAWIDKVERFVGGSVTDVGPSATTVRRAAADSQTDRSAKSVQRSYACPVSSGASGDRLRRHREMEKSGMVT